MAEEKNIPAAMTPEETAPQQAEIPAETPQEGTAKENECAENAAHEAAAREEAPGGEALKAETPADAAAAKEDAVPKEDAAPKEPKEAEPEKAPEEAFPAFTKKVQTDAEFSAAAGSAQGASHVERGIPCQDASDVRVFPELGIAAAGVADGVGSCPLSHFGSRRAVKAGLDALEAAVKALPAAEKAMEDPAQMQELLRGSMRAARDAVAALAAEKKAKAFDLASTLTLAVFDGKHFHCGHVGDDGAVVQFADGSYEMITQRCKGGADAMANSVIPLQAPETEWTFVSAKKPVVGFLLTTDGVLDNFVTNEGSVYYPFMQNFLYGTLPETPEQTPETAAQEMAEGMKALFDSEMMKERTGDDLTIAAVTKRAALEAAPVPSFSVEKWTAEQEALRRARYAALYPKEEE